MSSSKKLTGMSSSEFIDWRDSQSCWYFRPSFVAVAPTSLFQIPPTPSSLCQSTVHTDGVWPGGGGGCRVLLETIFCRTYKIA